MYEFLIKIFFIIIIIIKSVYIYEYHNSRNKIRYTEYLKLNGTINAN